MPTNNYSSELYHHGVKGMKWGVRRYQNKDGSLTSAGKRRGQHLKTEGSEDSSGTRKSSKLFNQTIKNGKDKSNISPAEKIAKESEKSVDNATKIVGNVSKIKSLRNNDRDSVKTMSNKELNDAINRLTLEKRYKDLVESSSNVSKGTEYVNSVLGIVGGVVGIAGSSLAIISTVKSLRSGG